MPTTYYGSGDSKKRFKFWLDNPPSTIAIDVETISLKERHPLGFGIAVSPDEAFYFDLRPEPPKELELVVPWLENMRIVKLAHNWLFDMGVFPLIPVVGRHLNRANIFDTNVAARLLGYEEVSLPLLAFEVNMQTTSAGEILKNNNCKNMMQLREKDPRLVSDHCQADARITFALYLKWKDKIASMFPDYFNIEMQVIPIVVDTSMKGLVIDQRVRAELSDRYAKDIDFFDTYIKSFGIKKPSSTQQVGYTLATRGNFLKLTRKRKQLSTREGELEFLSDPLAAAVLHYREKTKFKNTYLDPLEGADRFYTEYYFDTSVGRMNSRNRNIQNIPAKARVMILPDNGCFTTGDYSREHMYILAHKSQDRELLKVLYDPDPRKNDVHKLTAEKMNVPRSLAKTLNFAVAYGATARTVSEQAKIKDLNRCQSYIDDWFRAYKGAADWVMSVQESGVRSGWAEPTLFGRRIRIPAESDDSMRRKAVNYPILGSDGEVLKRAILLCDHRGLGPPAMSIFVHDSITWDGDVKDKIPVQELEMIPGFRIPFEVKATLTWE